MRLYYMTCQRWGLVILKERRLKLSTIPELNDPFELLGVSIGENNIRRIMKILHAHWSQTMGIICFTDNWHSPVMWAHYAEKHNGLCLGFDLSDDKGFVQKVRYRPHRLRNLLDSSKRLDGVDNAIIEEMLTTKYKGWSYEQEYRVFAELKDQQTNGLYYFDFGPELMLREVILGARCKLSVGSVAKAVGKPPHSVQVFKARPAFDSFQIVRQKRVTPLNIKAASAS